MRMGNSPNILPGPADTFSSYDLPWANASNTPFRRFKRWTHEGGISTPFIMSWPERIEESGIVHQPVHIIDIAATCMDAASATYPTQMNDHDTIPLEGESVLSVLSNPAWSREKPIFWEHEGSRAVRVGEWKLVAPVGGQWELYNINDGRTELHDLAESNKPKAQELGKMYDEWAERCGVQPWRILYPAWNPPMRNPSAHMTAISKR